MPEDCQIRRFLCAAPGSAANLQTMTRLQTDLTQDSQNKAFDVAAKWLSGGSEIRAPEM